MSAEALALFDDTVMRGDAEFSECGRYRYRLERSWGSHAGPAVVFAMLNPSKAGAEVTDPTVTRCVGFTRRLGYDRLIVVNRAALVATDPDDLRKVAVSEACGPLNAEAVARACSEAAVVIAAWGAHPFAKLAPPIVLPANAMCLGLTRDGAPRHPLYLPANAPLIPFGRQR